MAVMFGGAIDVIDAQLDALVASEKTKAFEDAAQVRLLAALAAADTSAKNYVREQIACALHIAPETAQRRIDVARTLVNQLPETLLALEWGVISYWSAMVLAEALVDLEPAVRAEVEGYVLRRAEGQTVGELRRTLARALARFDTRTQETKQARAREDRTAGWRVRRRDDGVTEWTDPTGRTYPKPPDELPRDTTLTGRPEPAFEEPVEPNPDPPPIAPPDDDPPPF